jgi:hypothetical protein
MKLARFLAGWADTTVATISVVSKAAGSRQERLSG